MVHPRPQTPQGESLKGHLHQCGKRAGRLRGSRSRVPQWIGLNELCGAVYTAAGPLRLRGGPAASARRDCSWSDSSAGPAGIGSADWSVFIDHWPSAAKRDFRKLKLRADRPALVLTLDPRRKRSSPAAGPAPCWCNCALTKPEAQN